MSRATRRFDEVSVGEELPGLDVELSASLIVAGALASRDPQDAHHDYEAARASGMQNIFMNILTTNGWVGRYVTDWAGPEARLENVKIRLGVPNYPGDTMKLRGKVVAKHEGHVDLEVTGANRLGNHVTGTVRVALPTGA